MGTNKNKFFKNQFELFENLEVEKYPEFDR